MSSRSSPHQPMPPAGSGSADALAIGGTTSEQSIAHDLKNAAHFIIETPTTPHSFSIDTRAGAAAGQKAGEPEFSTKNWAAQHLQSTRVIERRGVVENGTLCLPMPSLSLEEITGEKLKLADAANEVLDSLGKPDFGSKCDDFEVAVKSFASKLLAERTWRSFDNKVSLTGKSLESAAEKVSHGVLLRSWFGSWNLALGIDGNGWQIVGGSKAGTQGTYALRPFGGVNDGHRMAEWRKVLDVIIKGKFVDVAEQKYHRMNWRNPNVR